jgi:hypothetical protein
MEREYRITLTAERAAQVSAVNQACDEFEVSREDVEVLSAEPIAGRWSVRVRVEDDRADKSGRFAHS